MSNDPKLAGFKIKKITDLSKVVSGLEDGFIPESDLTLQHEQFVVQYEYQKPDEQKKETVSPGIYTLVPGMTGVNISKLELRSRKLLTSAVNTTKILNEANTFFNRLDVYEKLSRPKKRGVLLYSSPGLGKTSTISYFCQNMVSQDPGTVVINWPTDQVKSGDVCRFLSSYTEFTPECTKLVLIIEDIGGGERDFDRDRSVSSSLLNLLDGVDFVFKLPTFIIATTNHPENLLGALADRPGRFDLLLELKPPKAAERVELLKFIAKRDLTEAEVTAVSSDKANGFSIAHLEELVVRSMLHDKQIAEVIDELAAHSAKYKKGFEKPKASMGFSESLTAALIDLDD